MNFKILSIVLGIVLLISIILNITIPVYTCKNNPTKSSLLENPDYIISGLTTDQNNLFNAFLNPDFIESNDSRNVFMDILQDTYNMSKDQVYTAADGIVNDGYEQLAQNIMNAGLSSSDAQKFYIIMQTLSYDYNNYS